MYIYVYEDESIFCSICSKDISKMGAEEGCTMPKAYLEYDINCGELEVVCKECKS